MNIKEETDIALKDAYWAEVRKLYDAYLHAVTISQDKEQQSEAAADRFRKNLTLAQSALIQCQKLSAEIVES